jgi:hypothetical protein
VALEPTYLLSQFFDLRIDLLACVLRMDALRSGLRLAVRRAREDKAEDGEDSANSVLHIDLLDTA